MSKSASYYEEEASRFDNYDSERSLYDDSEGAYDPTEDLFGGKKTKKKMAGEIMAPVPTKRGNLTLKMVNPTTSDVTIELFNPNRSIALAVNPTYVSGAFAMRPYSELDPTTTANNSKAGRVGFDKDGNLVITGTFTDQQKDVVSISCRETSYLSLMQALQQQPMVITGNRGTYSNSDGSNPLTGGNANHQIDEPVFTFEKNILGATNGNSFVPRIFLRPDQYQQLIVDVNLRIFIGADKGVYFKLLAGTTVQWNLSVEM